MTSVKGHCTAFRWYLHCHCWHTRGGGTGWLGCVRGKECTAGTSTSWSLAEPLVSHALPKPYELWVLPVAVGLLHSGSPLVLTASAESQCAFAFGFAYRLATFSAPLPEMGNHLQFAWLNKVEDNSQWTPRQYFGYAITHGLAVCPIAASTMCCIALFMLSWSPRWKSVVVVTHSADFWRVLSLLTMDFKG